MLESRAGLYSLLLFTGYLNSKPLRVEEEIYELSIPNKEVAHIYRHRLLEWLERNTELKKTDYYLFSQLLEEGEIEKFNEELKNIVSFVSFHQTGKSSVKYFYNGLMVGILYNLHTNYVIEYESESGKGRADAILISKENATSYEGKTLRNTVVIEYKIAKDAQDLNIVDKKGLEQINAKGYIGKIKQYQHVKEVYKFGIAFCGKEVAVEWEVEGL